MLRDTNFYEETDNLAIINFLNLLVQSKESNCLDSFLSEVPLLTINTYEIHTSVIDKFI